jgi:SPP1 family predicted phage head-tail adaptor
MPAGRLRERIAFGTRTATPDAYGNPVTGDFADQFTVWASILPLKGGEGVQAARLGGTQPVIIRVRYNSQSIQIQPHWRARDTRTGVEYNITSAADMERKRRYIDIMAVAGVAVG